LNSSSEEINETYFCRRKNISSIQVLAKPYKSNNIMFKISLQEGFMQALESNKVF